MGHVLRGFSSPGGLPALPGLPQPQGGGPAPGGPSLGCWAAVGLRVAPGPSPAHAVPGTLHPLKQVRRPRLVSGGQVGRGQKNPSVGPRQPSTGLPSFMSS